MSAGEMSADSMAFLELMGRLMSIDNDVRKAAEEQFESVSVEKRANFLFECSKNPGVSLDTRNMALVLLRRLLSNSFAEIWQAWPVDVQQRFCTDLLATTADLTHDQTLRKRFADVVAELSRNTIDEDTAEQKWTDVSQFVVNMARSEHEQHKEIALWILTYQPALFGSQARNHLNDIKDLFKFCLSYAPSIKIRNAALQAICAYVVDNEEDQQALRACSELLEAILVVVAEHTQGENEDAEIMSSLGQIATEVPKFLRPRLDDVFTLCLKVVGDNDADVDLRHSSLETLVALCESAGAMVRKNAGKHLPDLVRQCVGLMVDVDEDPDWSTTDTPDDDDQESNATVGETSLDRVACALGAKTVLPPTVALVEQMLQSDQWQYRCAALLAISVVGEGCHKLMEPQLESVVTSILPFLRDPHPRVRYAACNAVGQMSTDFAPKMQKHMHGTVIPALMTTLDENADHARVQAHAGAAIVNFTEACSKETMAMYLDGMMPQLLTVLTAAMQNQQGKKLVLEQMVTTIAAVADSAATSFTPYYDQVMSSLKFILERATQPELALLRGKTIECISLVGLAVGSEKFLPDSSSVMELLMKAQSQLGGEGDVEPEETSYLISAWTRICKLMGRRFEQYLPYVMPAVIKAASLKPEVAVVENEDAEEMQASEDWAFVPLPDQQNLCIRTAGMEDKAIACEMLVCYARELKEGFGEYVREVTELLVPMLKFYFHDSVRSSASEAMPYLLESAKCKGTDFVREMWAFILPELLSAIEKDPDNEARSDHMGALADCIKTLGAGCLTDQHAVELKTLLHTLLEGYFKNQAERMEKRKEEDYDEEVENELVNEDDEDVYVLSKISDVLHSLFGTHGVHAQPFFDDLLPLTLKLLETGRPSRDLQWGICLFDDVLEFMGPQCAPYLQYCIPPMLTALQHEEAEVRQAAAYGFGVLGANAGIDVAAPVCGQALPLLVAMVQRPEARSTETETAATENAISAVAKILKHTSTGLQVDVNAALQTWLSWLPVWEDEEEAEHVYGYLLDLMEAQHPSVSDANLPGAVRILAQALAQNAMPVDCEETAAIRERVVNALRQLQANESAFAVCVTGLEPNALEAVRIALA